MGIIKKAIAHWTKSKDPNSSRYRHDMAEKICGYPIKYITQKNGDNEDVIGRSGSLNIKRETDELILSTPCCHHDLNKRLNSPALSFVAEHSMLRQKLCDAATDALRLKKLEASGYDVTALELIDPEETPKNIMLRGIRKHDPASARCRKAAEEYRVAYEFLTGEHLPG